jgi:site-specific recombinase XerD
VTQSATKHRLGSEKGSHPSNRHPNYPAEHITLPAEPLTGAEAEALMSAIPSRSMTGMRNRALATILYRAGLRIAEALALKASDIDPARGTVRVLRGKGCKPRTVGLDSGAMSTVQRWIDARKGAGIKGAGIKGGTLFCTLKGEPLSRQYVSAMLKRQAVKAGIDKRVHPHGLRHTHFSELAAEKVPINIISKQAGHANSGITARYIDHIAPADVIEAMRGRVWEEPGRD